MMKEISVYDLKINPLEVFSGDWMLLTAGDRYDFNTMTVAWGQLGSLWQAKDANHLGLPVATVFVRPQRYTKKFMDSCPKFTLSLFDKSQKKALAYLGSHSGRDGDKLSAVGLKPVFTDGTTYIDGADLVLICRKLYQAPLLENNFVDQSLREDVYPEKDYHDLYIGEVEKVLVKEDKIKDYT